MSAKKKRRKEWVLVLAWVLGFPMIGLAAINTPTPTETWTPLFTATPTATETPQVACCQGVTSLTGQSGHNLNGAGMVVDPVRHRLYAADFTGSKIQVFNSETENPVTFFSATETGSLIQPIDVALDGDGNLYVADEKNQVVEKYDANYNFICSIGQSLGATVVGVWADNQAVYFSTLEDFVYQYNGSGTSYSLAATFGGPTELNHPNELVKVDGGLYVADTSNNRVVRFDTANPSAAPSVVQSSLLFPSGIRTDLAGNFYVTESDNGGGTQFVDRYDPTFTALENQCVLPDVWGAAVNAAGQIFVSGLNSFSVTVLQGCALEPTLTPTPSYQGPNPPGTTDYFIYPSPVRGGQAKVAYTLKAPGRVTLTVWNEAGVKAAEVTDTHSAGSQSTTFSVVGWASGVYFCRLTLDYDSGETQKLSIKKFAVIH
ncbi:MAG: T9SS type A sorting domain-containing protein [bacterium]